MIASLEGSGGSERALTSRVNYLVKNYNYDITIVTTKLNSCNTYYDINPKVKIKNLPISFSLNSLLEKIKFILKKDNSTEKPLLEFIDENKFDICSSFGSETFLFKNHLFHPFVKIKENRFTHKKMLTDDKIPLHKQLWRYLRFRKSITIQKNMDYIITLTEEDASFWRKYLDKVKVMPNFIDFEKVRINSSFAKGKIVIAVGRLEKEKDFSSLIHSFQIVSELRTDWILNIFGEGSERKELQDLIFKLRLEDKVFLRGAVKNIYEEYQKSSIYVHTSIYEGFGLTILEAMAHSLPIVAFESVGGVKVLVEDKKNGFMIKNRSINNLAETLIQLIDNSKLSLEMGKHSREIAERYSEESIMENWHQFYSSF